jgi:hypothetical protein
MNDKSTLIELVAKKTNISFNEAMNITDVILEELHKRLAEYRGINGDYFGEEAHWELSERSFFHLLGIFDRLSTKYVWEPNSSSGYLLRLPPVNRWKLLDEEIKDWDWSDEQKVEYD